MTRYPYDPVTFRLVRQRTEAVAESRPDELHYNGGGRALQDTRYGYDLAGNIVEQVERASGSGLEGRPDELVRSFGYDALYRLVSATGRETAPGVSAVTPWADYGRSPDVSLTSAYGLQYGYDLLGNLLALVHQAATSWASYTRSWSYGSGTNQLGSVGVRSVGSGSWGYLYDMAGNVVSETSSRHFRWDAFGRLRAFATWAPGANAPSLAGRYCYDAGGERVLKVRQTAQTVYTVTVYVDGVFEHTYQVSSGSIQAEQVQLLLLDGTSQLGRVRLGDALGDPTPSVLYSVSDHLGSVGLQLDETGRLVSREEYYPFGETSFGSYGKKLNYVQLLHNLDK